MDISSVNSDLIRGNVTTIILGCLKDEDKYGYEILKEIEDKSHSQYALKQATLYNQLKRLEKQGLVSSYDGAPDDTGGGKRRYYALTPEGRNYLLKEKGEYEYARTILDKLVSENEFDFTKEIPFDASELRPYSKRGEGEEVKTKVVYKDKIVEVEKPVEIEKRIYIDRFGNPLTEEEYERATTQALLDDEQARITEEKLAEALQKLGEMEDNRTDYKDQLKVAEDNLAEALKKLNEIEEAQAGYEEQLKVVQQECLEKEQALEVATASVHEKEEELRLAEQQRMNSEAQLHNAEQERNSTEEELSASRKQLQQAEDKYAEYEEQLRVGEEERSAIEQQLHASEQQLFALQEELRKLHEAREAEEAMKREAQTKPSTTVDELFSKLEAQSEYSGNANERPTAIYADVPEDGQVYFEQNQTSQTTLQDLFRQMDEKTKEAEAERERKRQQEELLRQTEELQRQREEFERRQQEAASDALAYDDREFAQSELDTISTTDSYGATSATVTKNENGFEYEKNHVNYRDFFSSITDDVPDEPEREQKPQTQPQYADADIKTRLYSKGFKIRPYDKGNTSEYYTFNFIQSNRINRDTFLIVLALFLAEIAVLWLSLATRISYVYFLPITVAGVVLCLIPTAVYFVNPTRRTRANFNFKLSVLNRTMLFIELTVICILIGFFALGASVNDIDLILCSMVIPAIILLNLPVSSIIYYLLYRTRKYHIA